MHAVLGLANFWFLALDRPRRPMETASALDLFRNVADQGLTEAIPLLCDVLAENGLAEKLQSSRGQRLVSPELADGSV